MMPNQQPLRKNTIVVHWSSQPNNFFLKPTRQKNDYAVRSRKGKPMNDDYLISTDNAKLDIAVIHDAGAHGFAMGFNYNGKLRSAELLLRENGEVVQIRRAETVKDYLATLDFSGLTNFKV